ncbi:MAG: DUF3598 family protein [Vulcanococcus sp.]
MASQWDNFLRNLGEWRGTFTSLDREARELESTASILTLEQGSEERLVHFRLRRFADGNRDGEPSRDNREDYRSLGRQVVFFSSGSFCKGTLQVSPGTVFGGEFGFIQGDRRHRLVQLHREDGGFDQLVLIREWRMGSSDLEQPPLGLEQLNGCWSGQAQRITADWPEPDALECRFELSPNASGGHRWHSQLGARIDEGALEGSGGVRTAHLPEPQRFMLLPDGGYHLTPEQVSHRQPFSVEAGWLSAPDRLERLIRRFDASGAWQESIQVVLHRD